MLYSAIVKDKESKRVKGISYQKFYNGNFTNI